MRAVVIVPTYNEADNIQRFLTQVRSDAPNTDILVVDDNSPDGTSQIANEVADRIGQIKVMTRTTNRGYAAASRDAMRAAICDRSRVTRLNHQPVRCRRYRGRLQR